MLLECKGENMDGQRKLPDHRNECVMCPAVIMWSVWNNGFCLVHSDEKVYSLDESRYKIVSCSFDSRLLGNCYIIYIEKKTSI